jgi:hypothetical protein
MTNVIIREYLDSGSFPSCAECVVELSSRGNIYTSLIAELIRYTEPTVSYPASLYIANICRLCEYISFEKMTLAEQSMILLFLSRSRVKAREVDTFLVESVRHTILSNMTRHARIAKDSAAELHYDADGMRAFVDDAKENSLHYIQGLSSSILSDQDVSVLSLYITELEY